jgi:TetR/AcrR family transcriptional regulator
MSQPPRGSDTRARMLEVAETQFAQKGYEGAHLESIAQEVGVRKTALYYYFESKEALYTAVLERMLGALEEVVKTGLARDLPTAEKGTRLAEDLMALLEEHENYSQILIRIFVDRIPIDDSAIQPIVTRIVNSVLAFFSEGVKEGAFRKLSARHFFQSVLGMAIFHYAGGTYSAALLGVDDIFSPEAKAWRRREFLSMLSHGVLAEPERS